MLFTSIDFAIFLPVVFVLYWLVTQRNLRLQNALVVAASFLFYGWWDWRFLSLLLFSATIDFAVGRLLAREETANVRKVLLSVSLLTNLGLLAFFKYYNFFVENFILAFSLFGHSFTARTLQIILPVGISFYSFQTLSYVIDIYRRRLEPTHDFVAFLAFVSFFPQLVAGPIERATNLLPQFLQRRTFDYNLAADGMRQMLWGFFKKMVIADNCATYVDQIFSNPTGHSASTLLLGAVLFSVQIYCDFSGYSDIALGAGRLFGINLMQNFAFPYFSRDIAEFWRRWHISLSTWFRDYVYIPLGGSEGGNWNKVRNIFVVFTLSGFWHGANWTFIAWGALNALYLLPLILLGTNRKHVDIVSKGRMMPTPLEGVQMTLTFLLSTFGWIIFRADSLAHAVTYISGVASMTIFSVPGILPVSLLIVIIALFAIEWIGREQPYAIKGLMERPRVVRWSFYYGVIISIFVWGAAKEQPFIYFQF